MAIKVRWEVDDGYAGGSRPQMCAVELDDFQHCDDESAVRDQLSEIIQDEFTNRISWFMKNEDEVVALIMAAKARA